MNCRICGSESATAGQVEYYAGFAWFVYDCATCGCRFTKHDDSIYDWLHEQPQSIYALYREQIEHGRIDDALLTVRHFSERASSPAYFRYLEAQGWAAKQNWERAWNAWLAYREATRK